jgi:hypothetical protein
MSKWRYLLWLVAGILGITAPRLLADTIDLNTKCEFSGQVADMFQTTQQSGVALRVGMSGVSYSGTLTRTVLEQSQPGKVTLWFGLRNVRLTVSRTDIVGGPGSAACGPIDVVLGNQKDLWLAFDIEADTKSNSSQMVVREVRFQLPSDNWSIGKPAWVRTTGIGFTQQNVVDGLRQGIANDRATLQEKLMRDAPRILSQVVKQTTPKNAESPMVRAIRSRLQAWPESPQTLSSSLP